MNVNLPERLATVREKINSACIQAKRNPSEVTLVAVSKLKPVEDLVEVVKLGILDLGENYVQEWREKAGTWPDDVPVPRWHLIGPLQTNKVKFVVGNIHLIHTVDRIDLAQEIAKRAEAQHIRQKILIQIKIGDEESKHGVAAEQAEALIARAISLRSLEVCGLMSLPPITEDETTARGYFRELVSLRDDLVRKNPAFAPHLRQLSLGTSGDFLWAIAEGATMIRVGTAIFGERL